MGTNGAPQADGPRNGLRRRIPAILVLAGVVSIFASFAMANMGTATVAFTLMFIGALLIVGGLVLGIRTG